MCCIRPSRCATPSPTSAVWCTSTCRATSAADAKSCQTPCSLHLNQQSPVIMLRSVMFPEPCCKGHGHRRRSFIASANPCLHRPLYDAQPVRANHRVQAEEQLGQTREQLITCSCTGPGAQVLLHQCFLHHTGPTQATQTLPRSIRHPSTHGSSHLARQTVQPDVMTQRSHTSAERLGGACRRGSATATSS